MSAPFRVDDGNFKIPLLVKDGYRFPFSDKGDAASFEWVAKYSFDKSVTPRYRSMQALNKAYGTCYLVAIGDLDDRGEGLFEQELVYASLPVSRQEATGLAYTQQIVGTLSGSPVINEVTYNTSAYVLYEYFIGRPAPLRRAQFLFLSGNLVSIGGKPPVQGITAAQDSEISLYKGQIYQRRTMYVENQYTIPQPIG